MKFKNALRLNASSSATKMTRKTSKIKSNIRFPASPATQTPSQISLSLVTETSTNTLKKHWRPANSHSIGSSAMAYGNSSNWSIPDGNIDSGAFDDDYPLHIEPYSPLGATMTAIPVAIIIFVIVSGNALVIGAVLRDVRLQRQVQNWLIVSLAAADLLVGLLIMPLTLTYELLDEWVLGDVLCELWLALDVLFVTASILNLCAISLDRYWSLTKPTQYPQKRTGKRMLTMIVIVWCSAFAISFPPLVGWRSENRAASACFLSDQLGYVLYSALGSFFIPTLVLLFVYARIYCISRRRSKTKPSSHAAATVGVNTPLKTTPITPARTTRKVGTGRKRSPSDDTSSSNNDNQETPAAPPIQKTSMIVNGSNTARPSVAPDLVFSENDYAVLIAKVRHLATMGRNSVVSDSATAESSASSPDHNSNRALSLVATIASEAAARSRQHQQHQQQQQQPGQLQRPEPLVASALSLKKQLLQRQKLVRRRERQATLVLGLVLGAFVGSWLPFFCSYVLSATGLRTPPLLFDIVFWLGYCNSGLNAFIYNFFNPDFRRAFARILRGPIDKLRSVLFGSDRLNNANRRRSSTASALGGAPNYVKRKNTDALIRQSTTKRRGAVFSSKHPYLQIQQQQRQALISSFDNVDE